METKSKRIDLRGSALDERNIRKAASKLGTKKVSETIFHSVEQVANKSIEYGCDRPGIRDTVANIEYGRKYLQLFCAEFLELSGATLNRAELETCLKGIGKLGSAVILENAIRELVKTKLYQGLKVNHPDMTISMDNVPEKDLTRLFELADQLDNIPGVKSKFAGVYWSAYKVSESEVTIIQSEVDRLTDGYRFSASSPMELKKLSSVMSLVEVLNELLKDPEINPERVFSLVFYDQELKKFAPSGSYIKYNLQPTILFERKTY